MSEKKPQIKYVSSDGKVKIASLEEAKNFLFQGQHPMVAEGKMVRSYNDLLNFVAKVENRDKEIIEIKYFFICGG
jgi:hypothetical protein